MQLTLGEPHHGPVTAVVLRGNDLHAAIHGRLHTYDANSGKLQRTRTLLPCRVHGLACNEDGALLAWGVDAVGVAVSTVQVVLLPIVIGMLANAKFPKVVKKIEIFSPVVGVLCTCALVGSAATELARRLAKQTRELAVEGMIDVDIHTAHAYATHRGAIAKNDVSYGC